ncbi:MAG: TrmH family RNA methyltransferase, partial [Crocinitomicaceae bacterium]
EKNLLDSARFLQESGVNIISCSEKTDKTLDQVDFTLPTAIIMGSEERGISSELMELSNEIVKIPMSGSIESLNVGVASGMALYEVQRQRKS